MSEHAALPQGVERGLSVAEAVERLTNYYHIERELVHLSARWLPRLSDWDVKLRIGEFLCEDAEHANLLRLRLQQLRCYHPEPSQPSAELSAFLDQLHGLDDPVDFLVAVFQCLKGALLHTYGQYCRETDPLLDAPTERLLRRFIEEENRHLQWVGRAIDRMTDTPQKRGQAKKLRKRLKESIKPLGDLGRLPVGPGLGRERPDPILLSDVGRPAPPEDDLAVAELLEAWGAFEEAGWLDRFDDCETTGEALLEPGAVPWILYELANREMISAEVAARNIYLFQDMPWAFLYETARQVGDEVRHCEVITELLRRVHRIEFGAVPIDGTQVLELEELELFDRLVLYGHREEGNELGLNLRRAALLAEAGADPALVRLFDVLGADEIGHLHQIRRWLLYLVNDQSEEREKRLVQVLVGDGDSEATARKLQGFDVELLRDIVTQALAAYACAMKDEAEEVLKPVETPLLPVIRFQRPPSAPMAGEDEEDRPPVGPIAGEERGERRGGGGRPPRGRDSRYGGGRRGDGRHRDRDRDRDRGDRDRDRGRGRGESGRPGGGGYRH